MASPQENMDLGASQGIFVASTSQAQDNVPQKRPNDDSVRVFLDVEGNEISRGKRQRIENMDGKEKIMSIKFCIDLLLNIAAGMAVPYDSLLNHLQCAHIFATVYRIHEMARGIFNTTEKSATTMKRERFTFNLRLGGKDFSMESNIALEKWKEIAILHKWTPNSNQKEFFGKVGTIMALFNLFNQRLRELRLGPDSWIATKSGEKTAMNNVRTFGINAPYRHFLSGLSWDPSVRSTLSKHTTGLCQLSILSKGMTEKFTNRNMIAVERAFSHIANINTIANYVKRHEARENVSIINKMAHITNLCGDKHKRRASICPATIISYCTTFVPERQIFLVNEDKLADIGFSSKKAALLINHENEIFVPQGVDKVKFRQIYFHACNGTHSEDTGILKEMTTEAQWKTRGQIGTDFFKEILPQEVMAYEKMKPIKFTKYAKNISATQNDHIVQAGEVMGNMPIYAGYRMRRITERQIKYITANAKSSQISVENNLPSILAYLDDVISEVIREIKKNVADSRNDAEYVREGRVQWRLVSDASFSKDVDGSIVDVVPYESGVVFWS